MVKLYRKNCALGQDGGGALSGFQPCQVTGAVPAIAAAEPWYGNVAIVTALKLAQQRAFLAADLVVNQDFRRCFAQVVNVPVARLAFA